MNHRLQVLEGIKEGFKRENQLKWSTEVYNEDIGEDDY